MAIFHVSTVIKHSDNEICGKTMNDFGILGNTHITTVVEYNDNTVVKQYIILAQWLELSKGI